MRILGTVLAAALIVAVGTFALTGFKKLTEVDSERVLCPVIDEDGGISASQVTCGAGGFSSVACTNVADSTNIVYLGGSAVTTSDGYPICTTASSCAGSTVQIETGEVYCTTNTASADGGTPLRCLCGF